MTLFGEKTTLSYDGTVVAGVYEISGADSSVAEIERTPLGADSKQYRPSCQGNRTLISFRSKDCIDIAEVKLLAFE